MTEVVDGVPRQTLQYVVDVLGSPEFYAWNGLAEEISDVLKKPSKIILPRCSFCDKIGEEGNPWTGRFENNNGVTKYSVWGCKDHKDLVEMCVEHIHNSGKEESEPEYQNIKLVDGYGNVTQELDVTEWVMDPATGAWTGSWRTK